MNASTSAETWTPNGPTYRKTAGEEVLPGYILSHPLGQGGFGEVWECEAPGGLRKAIKFVFDDAQGSAKPSNSFSQEYEAFQAIKQIRHPFLLTLERVELVDGHLFMVMELADQNLADRFDECRIRGLSGIPRDELLGYLGDVAEGLDVISTKHGLQHLDVKPANLFLLGGRAKVGDFGLVRSQRAAEAATNRGLTPRYVAPEILQGRVDPRSDQYSLALVYQELLTSTFAYECKSPAHMLFQHATAAPNLRGLPPNDIPVVQRALSKNPAERWPTCSAFLEALMDTAFSSTIHETVQNLSGSSLLIRKARLARSRADAPRPVSAMEAPPPPASPSTIAGASNRGSSSLFSAPPVTATRESRALPGSTARPVPPPTTPVLDTNPALDEVIELAAVPPPPVPASPVPAPQPAHRPTPFAPPCAPTPRLLRSQLSRPSLTLEQPATHAIRLPKVWSIAPVSLLTGGTAIPDYHPSTTEFTDALVRAAMPNGTKPPLPGELIHDVHGWECRFPVKLMAGMLELKVIALSEAWRAELEWADAHTAILRLHQSGGLFAKLAGRKAGLEVTIAFSPSNKVLGEAVVTGRIFGNPDADFTRFASVTLPRMVDDAHSAIGNHTDRRIHSRVPAEFPLQLFPVTTEGVVYDAIMGRCRNVSLGGVCFDTATGVMPTGYVYTAFPGLGATHGWAILTRLLRSHREATGTHVFAGRFRSEY